MEQIKIIEGSSNEEVTINEWLKNNPDIEIKNINIIPMFDYYTETSNVCNQWYNTVIVYKVY